MSDIEIENLQIKKITENIHLVHQIKAPFHFSCSDGLLITSNNKSLSNIVIDANIEPIYAQKIIEKFGYVSDYICSHGHMDHIAHVHKWEDLGAKIHAPSLEYENLINLDKFYKGYGFHELGNTIKLEDIEDFARLNGYHSCNEVKPFEAGETLRLNDIEISTIPFLGHSRSHVGFYLNNEKLLHISCLGFDKRRPAKDGFGPWYGFRECSISQYERDIDFAEKLFVDKANYLTSSHSYVIKKPDLTPFIYMRNKIKQNHQKIKNTIDNRYIDMENDDQRIKKLLDADIFFPKKRMEGFLLKIYGLWEYWIIRKHIELLGYY